MLHVDVLLHSTLLLKVCFNKFMTQPTLNFVNCPDAQGQHRMAYWDWGEANSDQVIICAHGLSRQGRDFDVLAQALCDAAPGKLRVVCPDVVGRGKSDWLTDPMGYQIPQYAADMLALIAQLQPKTLDWVGTSMGGLIGMVMCGQPDLPLPVQVRKLILNDVGPTLEWSAIQRIGLYLGKAGQFDSVQLAADALWTISSSFGPHTSEQWLALSQAMVKPSGAGFALHYDPAIAIPFSNATEESTKQGEAMLWALYDNIKAQTLITRGAQSDLLSIATAQSMTQRGPKAQLIEFAGVGHAPTFIAADQVKTAVDFLLGKS
jgi:pimeloyl-ACP methyl ester carboxylesterase